jgi:DNA-binding transcriptional regulator YiaG
MGPVLWLFDETGANRVQREIANRGDQMLLVHRDGTEAALKQMASLSGARIHEARTHNHICSQRFAAWRSIRSGRGS